jgi:hypothetical protein
MEVMMRMQSRNSRDGLDGLSAAAGSRRISGHQARSRGMVAKALKYLKANNKDKLYAEVSKKDGQFVDRDLYLTVYGNDGVVRAHGANAKMIGKNLMEIKDVDGKSFVKERIELAKKNKPFWQEYKFTNPVSGKIEPKAMYCVPEEDMVVCGGSTSSRAVQCLLSGRSTP